MSDDDEDLIMTSEIFEKIFLHINVFRTLISTLKKKKKKKTKNTVTGADLFV